MRVAREWMVFGAVSGVMTAAAIAVGVGTADATPAAVTDVVRVPALVEIDVVDSSCDNTGDRKSTRLNSSHT